jgi:hypothetical protein
MGIVEFIRLQGCIRKVLQANNSTPVAQRTPLPAVGYCVYFGIKINNLDSIIRIPFPLCALEKKIDIKYLFAIGWVYSELI